MLYISVPKFAENVQGRREKRRTKERTHQMIAMMPRKVPKMMMVQVARRAMVATRTMMAETSVMRVTATVRAEREWTRCWIHCPMPKLRNGSDRRQLSCEAPHVLAGAARAEEEAGVSGGGRR